MHDIDSRLHVLAEEHQEEVAELVHVHSVIRHLLIDWIEEVLEDDWQGFQYLLCSNVIRVVIEVTQVVLGQQVINHPLELDFRHRAEEEIEEHVLVEHVCVLFEDLYFLNEAIVDHDH